MPLKSPAGRTKAQKFAFTEVQRSQINPAAYNPRDMEEVARKLLAKSLREFGVVEPVIWNTRTGNLVGGHQRLSILDEANGYPANDYAVGVALVDLDLKKEKQLNVWLNNKSAQGSFEKESMFGMLRSGLDLEGIGLTITDLQDEFGDLPEDLFPRIGGGETPADPKPKAKKKTKPVEPDPDDFVLVCFTSGDEKGEWLKSRSLAEGIKTMAIEDITAAELSK